MRKLFCISLLLIATSSQAQRFFENGLLYSDQVLAWLKPSFDTLHLLWQHRQAGNTTTSRPYIIGCAFSLDTLVAPAKADINTGISYADFCKKYPKAKIGNRIVSNIPSSCNIDGDSGWVLNSVFMDISPKIAALNKIEDYEKRFVIDYFRAGNTASDNGYIDGFFIEKIFGSQALPPACAKWVQYHDFLVGKEPLFLNSSLYPTVFAAASANRPCRDRFFAYIHIPNPPRRDSVRGLPVYYFDPHDFLVSRSDKYYNIWMEKRDLHIREYLENQPEFKELLLAAVEECLRLRLPDPLLENWAFVYLDNELALRLTRMRPVYSGCGNDPAPTQRAYEIGQMQSVESMDAHIFLLVHLYLIKDLTDWSVHSKSRFVGELEALGIDVPALLLGSVMEVTGSDRTHFKGELSRVGWALQECKNHDAIAKMLKRAIENPTLDDQNRANLYVIYWYMIQRKHWKASKKTGVNIADSQVIDQETKHLRHKLPAYLRSSISSLRLY